MRDCDEPIEVDQAVSTQFFGNEFRELERTMTLAVSAKPRSALDFRAMASYVAFRANP